MSLERNRELVHRLVEIVNARELEAIDEVASGEFADAARRWVDPFGASFPDFRMVVVDVIAEEDRVVGCFKCSGTHTGEWRGHAPTGRRFDAIDEVYVFRIEDGKLASAVLAVEDNLTRLSQLGLA